MAEGFLSAPVFSITGFLQSKENLVGVLSAKPSLTATISKDASVHYYEGDYIFTPTQEMQEANTANKLVSRDIIVNPIPSNYGLISWNGSYLTVS